MARPQLVECSFFIPTRRDREMSDGRPHPEETWKWLATELYNRFEAETEAPGLYHGLWRSPKSGMQISDVSRRFLVAIARSKCDELRLLLREACEAFKQQAIYLSIAGAVEFVRRPSA